MRILAISGSLRSASINTAFCRSFAALAGVHVDVRVFADLQHIPLFNPDLDSAPPDAVRAFRSAVDDADALLIASPEYAHGVSGVMKNALDWLVSYEPVVNKPVALVNTSARAHHAYEALKETLTTMSLDLVPAASVTLPLLGFCTTEAEMLSSSQVNQVIRDILNALSSHRAEPVLTSPLFPVA